MSTHPVAEWEAVATRHADRCYEQHTMRPLWLAEYRAAYAEAAGLNDDIPAEPDAELQQYLTSLDDEVRKERREYVEWLRGQA